MQAFLNEKNICLCLYRQLINNNFFQIKRSVFYQLYNNIYTTFNSYIINIPFNKTIKDSITFYEQFEDIKDQFNSLNTIDFNNIKNLYNNEYFKKINQINTMQDYNNILKPNNFIDMYPILTRLTLHETSFNNIFIKNNLQYKYFTLFFNDFYCNYTELISLCCDLHFTNSNIEYIYLHDDDNDKLINYFYTNDLFQVRINNKNIKFINTQLFPYIENLIFDNITLLN